MYTTANLVKVEDNQTINRYTHFDFFYELQCGVLLSLKERGVLTQMQYRTAEEILKDQRRECYHERIEGGSTS